MKRIGGVVGILVLAGLGQAAPLSPAAPAGLQAEWNFAEGRGATAGDSSGNSLHSTLQNGAAWTPSGRIGGAIQLDGVNDFVALPANSNLVRNAPGATLATWINISSYPASGVFKEVISIAVNSTSGTTNTSRAALAIKGDGTRADLFAGARSTDSEAQQTLTADVNLLSQTWVHCTAVADFAADSLKIYVNGTLAASATVAFSANSTPDTASTNGALGAQDKGDSNFLHAKLDQVRIYNRALSASEIQALASGDSLQAHWRLDDGSGLIASDASGNLNTGALKNGLETGWVGGGQVGGALQFDGVDDFVQVDAPGLLQNVNAATVALWIKPSSTIPAGSFRELVSISIGGAASDVSRFALALRGDGSSAGDVFVGGRSADGETQKNTVHDSSLVVGEWTHVAGVANFAQGTLEIYINGLLAATAPAAFVQPSTSNSGSPSIALGAQDTGSSNRYAGAMDEARVYGRALTACEIQELAGRDGLQAYWKFDETGGTTAADSSATGLAATLKNGATFVPGKLGNALNLDGTNQYADLGLSLPILKGSNAATVAAWINLSSVPPSGAFREVVSIAVGGSPSNTSRLALAIKGTGAGTADLFVGGRSTDLEAQQGLTAVAGIQPGTWRHVAATLDFSHNQIRLFLDGSQIASVNAAFSQPVTPTTAPANGALGAQDLGTSNFNHVKLDEVRIYCRVLSAAEIASLAASVAPAAPVLSLVEEGNQQVKLSWTTVPGADFYNLKRSTTQGSGYVTVTSTGTTSFTDTGLTNDVTYHYVVTAQNSAGESGISNDIPATARAAVPPPPVILVPPNGAYLATSTPTVSGTSSSPGLTIRLQVDGQENGVTTSVVVGNWSLGVPNALGEGPHALRATATNGSGTSGLSNAVQIVIDTIAPVVSNPVPQDQSTVFSTTPSISASWSDANIDPSTAEVRLDGNLVTPQTITGSGFTFTPLTPLSLTSHSVTAKVKDLSGNESDLLAWSFSVTNLQLAVSNPSFSYGAVLSSWQPTLTVTLTNPQGSGINPAALVVRVDGTIMNASITVIDDNTITVSITPSTPLSEGAHSITIDGLNGSGIPVSTITYSFGVDLTPPEIQNTVPGDAAVVNTSALTISTTVTDTGGSGVDQASFVLRFDGQLVTPTISVVDSNTVNLSFIAVNLTDGPHAVSLDATDRAGNVARTVSSGYSVNTAPVTLPPPVISSLGPNSGALGSPVVIRGNNLVTQDPSAMSVTFSLGVQATVLLSVTQTEIIAIVPDNAGTGPVSVTVNGVRSNEVSFTVIPDFGPIVDPNSFIVDGAMVYPLNQVVLRLGLGYGMPDAQAIAQSIGAQVVGYLPPCNAFVMAITPAPTSPAALTAVINLARADARVAGAIRNYVGQSAGVSTDLREFNLDRSLVWAFDRIQAQGAWDCIASMQANLHPVNIAVIDMGFCIVLGDQTQFTNPRFQNVNGNATIVSYAEGVGDGDPGGAHGTAVAGIIGAKNTPSPGVAGTAFDLNGLLTANNIPFTLQVWRIAGAVGDDLRPSMVSALRAVGKARKEGARVINLSLSFPDYNFGAIADDQSGDFPEARFLWALTLATMPDTLIVSAAGNETRTIDRFIPAGIVGPIGLNRGAGAFLVVNVTNNLVVAGSDRNDAPWDTGITQTVGSFMFDKGSAWGPGVALCAPAEGVYALDSPPGATYQRNFGGTSAAAPMVAGTAALLLSINNGLKVKDLKKYIVDNGTPMAEKFNGGKRLNVCRAVAAVLGQNTETCCGGRIVYGGQDGGAIGFFRTPEKGTTTTYLGPKPDFGANNPPLVVSRDGTKYGFFDGNPATSQSLFAVKGLFDVSSQTVGLPLDFHALPTGIMRWHPDGRKVFFYSNDAASIGIIDIGMGSASLIQNTSPGNFDLSYQGNTLAYWGDVVQLYNGNVGLLTAGAIGLGGQVVIDAHSECNYTKITDPTQPTAPVTIKYTDTVLGAGGTASRTELQLFADGRRAVFHGWGDFKRPDPNNPGSTLEVINQGIFVVDPSQSPISVTLLRDDQGDFTSNPIPSPDGQFVVFRGEVSNNIYLQALDLKSLVRALAKGQLTDFSSSVWSQDGTGLLVMRNDGQPNFTWSLYRVDRTGNPNRNWTVRQGLTSGPWNAVWIPQ